MLPGKQATRQKAMSRIDGMNNGSVIKIHVHTKSSGAKIKRYKTIFTFGKIPITTITKTAQ